MKNLLVSLLCCILTGLFCPAGADQSFDSLCKERDRLFKLIITGRASSDDVNRFNSVVSQIQQSTISKIQANSSQMSNIYYNLDRMQSQNTAVSNSLFGGSSGNVDQEVLPVSSNPVGITLPPSNLEQLQTGQVNYTELISTKINSLFDAAVAINPQIQANHKQVIHFSTPAQRLIATGKDAFNYLIPFRGLDPSIEAANLILDEGVKVKTLASAQYAEQRSIDDLHQQMMIAVFELAMGVGTKDADVTQKGYIAFKNIVGDDADNIKTVFASISDPVSPVNWDVNDKQDRQRKLIEVAINNDSVIQEIFVKLHKYNHRHKGSPTAAKIIMPALGLAALTPTFVGPTAKGALLGYIALTGGPMENQLTKELFLAERLEDRMRMITAESSLALDYYELGSATNNPALVFCAQSLVQQMSGNTEILN